MTTSINRWVVKCPTCRFRWTTEAWRTTWECPQGHSAGARQRQGSVLVVRRIVHRSRDRGGRGCRVGDRRLTGKPDSTAPGACSWECRASFSALCVCPCGGQHHGTMHALHAALGAPPIDDIYARIEASQPRGDAIVRKLEARRRRR